jgi:hypothetical protein
VRSDRLRSCSAYSLLNAFATPRHRHHHRSSFRSYSTRSTHHGRYRRSTTAKNNFKREHPCPSNGRSSGSCPGYVIDHINPLECGRADAPFNMQWQTIAEGKAKDKTERNCRLQTAIEHLYIVGKEDFAFCFLSISCRATLPISESFFVNIKRSSGARSARPVFPALPGDDRCCQPLFSAAYVGPSGPTHHRKSSSAPFS